MDNLGILGFLNNLSKFYQDNKNDFSSETANEIKDEPISKSTTEANKKPSSPVSTPYVHFNKRLLEIMENHDKFVKRVEENNKTTPTKKRGRKPKQQCEQLDN